LSSLWPETAVEYFQEIEYSLEIFSFIVKNYEAQERQEEISSEFWRKR
jgi:hypothetical protein